VGYWGEYPDEYCGECRGNRAGGLSARGRDGVGDGAGGPTVGILELLPSLMGTGGLDIKGGTLKTGGVSNYSGAVTLEQGDMEVTGGTEALGTGPLSVAGPFGSAWSPPTIDVSAISGATLANEVTLQKGAELDVTGKLTLVKKMLLDQESTIETQEAQDNITVQGQVGGSGHVEGGRARHDRVHGGLRLRGRTVGCIGGNIGGISWDWCR